MTSRRLAALVLLPALLAGCSGGSDGAEQPALTPEAAASAPVPGITLPPDDLVALVPQPDEVPAGMVPVLSGSGPKTLDVVAGYSSSGPAAVAGLKAHGFERAYVAQYASEATGQVVSVLVTRFATAAGATADLADDLKAEQGKKVPTGTLGEQSSVTLQDVKGGQLVLARFRRGVNTWSLAYQAPAAEPSVAIDLAKRLLDRTAS